MTIDVNRIITDILNDYTTNHISVSVFNKDVDTEEDNRIYNEELINMIHKYIYGSDDEFIRLVLSYLENSEALELNDDVDIIYLCDVVAQNILKEINN